MLDCFLSLRASRFRLSAIKVRQVAQRPPVDLLMMRMMMKLLLLRVMMMMIEKLLMPTMLLKNSGLLEGLMTLIIVGGLLVIGVVHHVVVFLLLLGIVVQGLMSLVRFAREHRVMVGPTCGRGGHQSQGHGGIGKRRVMG